MKRLTIWTIVVAFLFMLVSPVQAATKNSDVSIVLNGREVTFDVNPHLEEGRVLIPVRGVFEKLDLKVKWDQSTKTATIQNEEKTIVMKLGEKVVQVNGKNTVIDTAVSIKGNRLFIPVRFVSATFGGNVKWVPASKIVHITTDSFDEETKELLAKLSGTELNSFSTKMDIVQTMSMMGEEVTVDMTLDMDMVVDPFGMYQYMNMSMEQLGNEGMTSESYFTKDGFYSYDSMMDQWVKYDDAMTEDLLDLSNYQMDPIAQFEMMEKYYQNVVVIENKDTYELYTSISGDGFQDLLDEMLNVPGMGLGEGFEMDMTINQMDMVTIIDKETFYPLSGTMVSNMTMGIEGEEINIAQDVEYTYSNINEIEEIVIPQEVIDKAVPVEELETEPFVTQSILDKF